MNVDTMSLNEIANDVEEKMTQMCGCLNCISTVRNIILDDIKPFNSQCNACNKRCHDNRLIFPHTIGDITFYNVEDLVIWVKNQQEINKKRWSNNDENV